MREIKKVFIHCSASLYGDFWSIDRSHKDRGWDGVWDDYRGLQLYFGYHWYICNPFQNKDSYENNKPNHLRDGMVIRGRPEEKIGAHVEGENAYSIGICYGGLSPTPIILLSLQNLVHQVLLRYKLNIDNVFGHYEVFGKADEPDKLKKTCPNINMDVFREHLRRIYGTTIT